eukprot:gene11021-18986_t
MGSSGGARSHEISFQDFKAKLLAKGVVARLEVANHSTVKVFVKADAALAATGEPEDGVVSQSLGNAGGGSQMRYFFQV